jgi:protein TonB
MRRHFDGDSYSLRLFASIIAAQVLVLLCIKLWPNTSEPKPLDILHSRPEVIQMEEVVSTRQTRRSPPPPAPLPPVIAPDDTILEEDVLLDLDPLVVTDPSTDEMPAEPEGTPSTGIAATEGPKLIRLATPEYSRSARRRNIHAEIIVAVVVDKQGRVQSPQIVKRYLLNEKSDTRELVNALGHGLEEAAVDAAMRSLFRPARKDGAVVESNHEITFRFGV